MIVDRQSQSWKGWAGGEERRSYEIPVRLAEDESGVSGLGDFCKYTHEL